MLRVTDVTDLGPETIRTTRYSFEVEWPASLGQPFYWRAGLVSGSLLDIGIHYRSGRLKSIGLPLAKRVSGWPAERTSITAMGLPEQAGAPVFHVEEDWVSNPDVMVIDDPDDFIVCVDEHRIALDFGDCEHVTSCIRSGKVSFGIDQDGLLHTIEVDSLTDVEMWHLRAHLNVPE